MRSSVRGFKMLRGMRARTGINSRGGAGAAAAASISFLFMSILFMSLLVLSCASPEQHAQGPEEPESYLVVMSAFSPELTRLLGEAEIRDIRTVGGDTCFVASLGGVDVVMLLSGIGLEKAALKTEAVLDSFTVSGLVFSGIAGGINPNLNIGDVTVPARWAQADGGGNPEDDGFWMQVDTTMLAVASGIAGTVALTDSTPEGVYLENPPVIVIGGNGVSNTTFVDDAVYREWLWETFEANAVDMETSAVARICWDRGVPYIAFRSLSDLAGGGPGANEVEIFFQLAADNAAAVVLAFLDAWETQGSQ